MPLTYQPIAWDGGVNLLSAEQFLQPNEVRRAQNLFPIEPGKLGVRGALGHMDYPADTDGVGAIRSGRPIAFMIPPWNGSSLQGVVLVRNITDSTALAYSTGEIAFRLFGLSPEASVVVNLGGVNNSIPAMVPFNNKVYAFGGYPCSKAGVYIQDSGGVLSTGDFAFAGSGNNAVRPRVAGTYTNRMVFANFGPGYENHMIISDLNDPTLVGDDVLAVNSRNFIVGDIIGDEIVAVHEVMTAGAGSPAQSALLILKKYSAYLLQGQPSQTTDTGDYLGTMEIVKFEVAAGCVAPLTVVSTPEGLFWAGPDEVWCYKAGTLPFPVGRKIGPALKNTPDDKKYRWHAAYFDGRYRLAIFSAGQGPDDDTPLGEQWWLDLRDGTPQNWQTARWWGPQVYKHLASLYDSLDALRQGTHNMAAETRPGEPAALYGIEAAVNPSNGEYGYVRVQYDRPGSSYDYIWAVNVAAGYGMLQISGEPDGDYDTRIQTSLLTRAIDFGDPGVEKLMTGAEADVFVSLPAMLTAQPILNGGETAEPFYAAVPTDGFIAGVTELGDEDTPLGHIFRSVSFDQIDNDADVDTPFLVEYTHDRPVGRRFQLEFSHAGLYGAGGEDINSNWSLDVSFSVIPFATFVPANYEVSIETFGLKGPQDILTALGTAITAAVPAIGFTPSLDTFNDYVSLAILSPDYYLRFNWDNHEDTQILLNLLGVTATGPTFLIDAVTPLTGAAGVVTRALAPALEITSLLARIRPLRRRPTK